MTAAEARAAVFKTVRREVSEDIEAFLPVVVELLLFSIRLYSNQIGA
jgi:hypothetical protein